MRQAQSELVAFLTQDAVPASEDWLAQLVEFMDTHPEVAGAFGRQVAHAGADPLEAWEIARHFESFTNQPSGIPRGPGRGPTRRRDGARTTALLLEREFLHPEAIVGADPFPRNRVR